MKNSFLLCLLSIALVASACGTPELPQSTNIDIKGKVTKQFSKADKALIAKLVMGQRGAGLDTAQASPNEFRYASAVTEESSGSVDCPNGGSASFVGTVTSIVLDYFPEAVTTHTQTSGTDTYTSCAMQWPNGTTTVTLVGNLEASVEVFHTEKQGPPTVFEDSMNGSWRGKLTVTADEYEPIECNFEMTGSGFIREEGADITEIDGGSTGTFCDEEVTIHWADQQPQEGQ